MLFPMSENSPCFVSQRLRREFLAGLTNRFISINMLNDVIGSGLLLILDRHGGFEDCTGEIETATLLAGDAPFEGRSEWPIYLPGCLLLDILPRM